MNHNHEQKNTRMPREGSGYTCPMHPEVVRDRPGICPECGMNLVRDQRPRIRDQQEKHRSSGKHEGHSTAGFLKKFWVSFALTLPIVWYSELPERAFDITAPTFPGSEYLAVLLSSIVFFYGGLVFLAGAWREMRGRLPGMMTLIAIAISAAYVWSLYATVALGGVGVLYWELATLITVMLLGHWIEMKAVAGTQGALKELAKLIPDTAEVLRNGVAETVAIRELAVGDSVLVKPGARIPADGEIIEGNSDVDESVVTGESKPVSKIPGMQAIAGTVNGDGSLTVRIDKLGDGTFLAGVMRLVAEAQASKSKLQILSDRAALYLTVVAVVAGMATLGTWLSVGAGLPFAVERLVAVLVIACPHALGLAVPLVASFSTSIAARNGFLVKQRLALESARAIDIVLFDKTGTLTKGEFGVSEIVFAEGINAQEVLRLAASVNQNSEHPIGKAVVAEARRQGTPLSPIENFRRIPGKGAEGTVAGSRVLVGSDTLLAESSISSGSVPAIKQPAGKTVVHVIEGNAYRGSIALVDVIRDESREAIKALKEAGIRSAMVTGDSRDVAEWVAQELEIDEYFANVPPEEKALRVKELQAKGLRVAMVGDGVNDAPALTQADLGIAVGAGTNVAIESAGIILARNDPRDIPKIVHLSQATYRKMIQNLWWASGYNIVALPLAAGVLASKGVILNPAVGAIFMSLSTVIVAINALLLKRVVL